jgi:pimeloyl-ACP methyl ester carboxylesterase
MSFISRFKRIYHLRLARPFKLSVRIDRGSGATIVFLHGIAADYRVWNQTIQLLDGSARLIALDLLGCGESPEPDYLGYSLQDQARSVIHTLKSLRLKQPVILVGHSLGSLVAIEIARLNPNLASRLILASPPIFTDEIPDLAARVAASLYNSAYLALLNQPRLTTEATTLMGRFQSRDSAIGLTTANWNAFRQTLRNAVLDPKNYNRLLSINVTADIIYGRFDTLILKKPLTTAASVNKHLAFHRINESHIITTSYAGYLAKFITVAVDEAKHHKETHI